MTIREAVTKQKIRYKNGSYYLIVDLQDYSLPFWDGFDLKMGDKLAVEYQMGLLKKLPVGTDGVQTLYTNLIRETRKGRPSTLDRRPRLTLITGGQK
jgi:hypothetical protein